MSKRREGKFKSILAASIATLKGCIVADLKLEPQHGITALHGSVSCHNIASINGMCHQHAAALLKQALKEAFLTHASVFSYHRDASVD